MKKERVSSKRKFASANYFIIAGIVVLLAVIALAVYQNKVDNNSPLNAPTTCKVYISVHVPPPGKGICSACDKLRDKIKAGQLEKCDVVEYATWKEAEAAGHGQLPEVLINGKAVTPNTVTAMAKAINAL